MVYENQGKLLENIQATRQAMVQVGMLYGLNHPETLHLSRQLDDLLNDLHKPENRHLILLSDRKSQVTGYGLESRK